MLTARCGHKSRVKAQGTNVARRDCFSASTINPSCSRKMISKARLRAGPDEAIFVPKFQKIQKIEILECAIKIQLRLHEFSDINAFQIFGKCSRPSICKSDILRYMNHDLQYCLFTKLERYRPLRTWPELRVLDPPPQQEQKLALQTFEESVAVSRSSTTG